MPAERVAMRKIREVLRLHFACGLSKRRISPLVGVGPTAVGEYIVRARRAGFGWPLPEALDDEALERRLFPPQSELPDDRPTPDWPSVAKELRRKGVTLRLLWEEYRAAHSDGYGYSWFCDGFREWSGRLSPTMRQSHRAGERLFVDYAGQTVPVVDPQTGEVRQAQIFIAVLGASNLTFAYPSWSQKLPDWIAAHVAAFEALGGVPELVVCDNLKAGVTKASRVEPTINATYREMAEHYGVAVLPTRPRKPRDKAKVEVAVQIVERWILARLRNQTFFGLAELASEIARLTDDLNARIMRHLGISRREMFERTDRPALRPLPETPYDYAEWRRARVGIDYHVEVDARFYSVPYRLLKEEVDVRVTARTVEVFHRHRRVASHARVGAPHAHVTVADHMPSHHRQFRDWTHERVLREAAGVGDNARALVEVILRSRRHPEQGFRSCVGILRLARTFGSDRLEAACGRSLEIGAHSWSSVRSILQNGLDRSARRPTPSNHVNPDHGNLRGPGYYH